ncbi:SpoIIE family protein phosphatase [Cellvibrio sp.]|uniref:ATP-binding SpoIIE family protein phosphatase n=1 Tax=Cellvibrio sp. TaxID=1965322 RepID=UPI0039647599
MNDLRNLKILVADDTDADRLILETIVRKEGHHVFSARNGLEAVDIYRQERPDIVLLDALMPELDGFEAARQIKQLAGDELVPIIFLTSLQDTDSLVSCLDAGGDDFLSKPYNRVILKAKIKSFNRMRGLHNTMIMQRDQLSQHHRRLLQEQTVAKQVFDNVAHSGCLNANNVRYFLSSLAVFNGDVLVAGMRPNGNMMVLLGDFTGHGLPAAIGAMPLASTFYGMVNKGFSMSDVLREINKKLKSILPVGLFCCATMIDFNFRKKRIKVWNGGLPAGMVYRKDGSVIPLRSTHLPLGVLAEKSFKDDTQVINLDSGDRVFMWSDGIHEARNAQGEMFGEERLLQLFEENECNQTAFDEILLGVKNFIGSGEQDDDLSMIEICMDAPENLSIPSASSGKLQQHGQVEWELRFEVKPTSFKTFDPLPFLLNILTEEPDLRGFSGSLYTILAELYSNALEHGVLGLGGDIKKTPEGFANYYTQREKLLNEITTGFVHIYFAYSSNLDGGSLTLRVEDSGKGFDFSSRQGKELSITGYSGRGISLVEKLCKTVRYYGCGNKVEVVFEWANDD